MRTVSCHSLVDRVIDSLIDKMMKTFFAYVSYIHCRSFSDGLKSLEYLYITRGIITFFSYIFCHFFYSQISQRKVTQNL